MCYASWASEGKTQKGQTGACWGGNQILSLTLDAGFPKNI